MACQQNFTGFPAKICKWLSNCHDDKCLLYHPTGKTFNTPQMSKVCKFGSGCNKDDCPYVHTPQPSQTTNVCKYEFKVGGCKNINCTYDHPSRNVRKLSAKPSAYPALKPCVSCCFPIPKNDNFCGKCGCAQTPATPQHAGFSEPSNVPCKFGAGCTKRLNCPFKHPEPCRHGSRCTFPNCKFAHPEPVKPCKFGTGCTNPTCKFGHTEVVPDVIHVAKTVKSPPAEAIVIGFGEDD